MNNSLLLEVVRILLRYLAGYLLWSGAPEWAVDPLGDPATVGLVAGLIALAISEGGWARAKLNEWRKNYAERS